MSTATAIRERIKKMPRGKPFTAKQLLALGSRASVDQALSRLARAGEIMRVAKGVYARPKVNKYVGNVPPSVNEVVKVIARERNEVIRPTGAEAARRFRLTTQMPVRLVFNTSGSSRIIKIGNQRVEFRHASPSALRLAERPAGEAYAALRFLGKKNVTPTIAARVLAQLPKRESELLLRESSNMPAWLGEKIRAAGIEVDH